MGWSQFTFSASPEWAQRRIGLLQWSNFCFNSLWCYISDSHFFCPEKHLSPSGERQSQDLIFLPGSLYLSFPIATFSANFDLWKLRGKPGRKSSEPPSSKNPWVAEMILHFYGTFLTARWNTSSTIVPYQKYLYKCYFYFMFIL